MPLLLLPSGELLAEVNHCHGLGTKGHPCEDGHTRPAPIKVKTVEEAITAILAGKIVEVADAKTVNTVLTKLAAMALDAKSKGQAAPNYDLCKVSVAGTNIFCADRFTSERYPLGVPRLKMPQFKAVPEPGSQADKLEKSKKGTVDATPQFLAHLKSLGIRTTEETVPAARLKATQAELVGPTVAAMMANPNYDPAKEPMFVSRDNYVVDGHHRWAALVGRDAADGKLGDVPMHVIRVDAPMSELLKIAKQWTKSFGLAPRGLEPHL